MVCLIGASGLVGQALLQRFIDDEHCYKITCFSRKQIKKHAKLNLILGDNFVDLFKNKIDLNGTYFYSCLGTTMKKAGSKKAFYNVDYDINYAFAKLANTHHAKSFSLVSSHGANASSIFFYLRVKGRLEDNVKSLKNIKKILFFRPGLILGNRNEFRLSEALAILASKSFSKIIKTNTVLSIVNSIFSYSLHSPKAFNVYTSEQIKEFLDK